MHVPLSRDMAIVVRRKLLPDMALALQTKYRDPDAWLSRGNRHLFLCPWRGKYTLVGVNSRVYEGNPHELTVSEPEIEVFVNEIREAWPALNLRREDVSVVNAGLLPFGENAPGAKDLSFGHRSHVIDHGAAGGPEGLYTGMAVRWTMGRLIGEQLTDAFLQRLERPAERCLTRETPVWAAEVPHDDGARTASNDGPAGRWPSDAAVAQCTRDEMVVTLRDLVLRRLDLGTGECPDRTALETLASIAGRELGWSESRQASEVRRVEQSYPFASPASQAYSGKSA
jgi:glycerol-3-phosphate dehydrogenase